MTAAGAPSPHLRTPAGRPRARALGVPFDGEPGPWNAITDVPGVAVGYRTLVRGDGPLVVGQGPVRTGVTAVLPRPPDRVLVPVFAGLHRQNGNGELTGAHLIAEVGQLALPMTLTNTHACGITRDATIEWARRVHPDGLADAWGLPVAGETYDGFLNDVNGGHVTAAHAIEAIDRATAGPLEEGSVGGGTGMIAFELKAGSGTASRRLVVDGEGWTVGVFVQANFGRRRNLTVRGRRLGPDLPLPLLRPAPPGPEKSSIIGLVATDAPLLPHQCARLARRAPLGVALTGGFAYHSSGDLFLAFSTGNVAALSRGPGAVRRAEFLPDDRLDALFDAVVQGTEEAILNALVAAEPMAGRDGHLVPALPPEAVRRLFAS
jgi:L-aminopeptidase/D-esterase-like protein